MKLKILYWILIGAIVLLSVGGLVKSYLVQRGKEQLEQRIKDNGQVIKDIQKKRDSANAVTIPFSDSARTKVVESVNDKNGFDLSVRPKGRD